MADIHQIIVEVKADGPALQRTEAETKAALRRAEAEAKRASKELAADFARSADVAFEAMKKSAREQVAAQRQASRETAKAAKDAAREQEAAARKASDAARAAADAQRAANAKLAAAYREIVGPAAEYNAKLREAIALERQGAITAQQRAQYVHRLQTEMRSFNVGGVGGAPGGGGIAGMLGGAVSGQLVGLAGAGAVAALGREALSLSDSYANLTSRLVTLTGSEEAAIPLRSKLLALAQDTKVANTDLVNLYVRIAGSVKELNVSERDTIAFTERLAKAFKLSGSSTHQQQQAMEQLAQGMSEGALRGEDFNSVMSAAPNIIDIVAEHLGKTRGEMRKMAEAGQITTKQVMDAFAAAGDKIDRDFGKRIVTTSEQWVGFKNKLEVAVGEMGRSIDVGNAAGIVLDGLAKSIDNVSVALKAGIDLWNQWNNATGGFQGKLAKAGLEAAPSGAIGGFMEATKFALGGVGVDVADEALIAKINAQIADYEKVAVELVKTREELRKALFPTVADGGLSGMGVTGLGSKKPKGGDRGDGSGARERAREIGEAFENLNETLATSAGVATGYFSRIRTGVIEGLDAIEKHTQDTAAAAARAEKIRADALAEAQKYRHEQFREALAQFDKGTEEFAEAARRAEEESNRFRDAMVEFGAGKAVEGIDAFIESINGADVSLREFVTSALIELEKLLVKLLLLQGVKLAFGGDITGGLGGTLVKALGFAAGTGSAGYVVPNNGRGTDGVPVHMRLSPGERVHVTPAGRTPSGDGAAAPVNVTVRAAFVNDMHEAMREFMQSTEGERFVLGHVTRNAGKLRGAMS